MKVMLLESHRGAADDVAAELEHQGHEVRRCHEAKMSAFPCNALIDGAGCPLEGGGVDVAVTVRPHVAPRPSALEDGVTCALRAGVPLVVAGNLALNPYEPWATQLVDEERAVAACERAAAGGYQGAVAVIRAALAPMLPVEDIEIVVRRQGEGLQIRLTLPHELRHLGSRAAVRAVSALRRRTPDTKTIDVSVA